MGFRMESHFSLEVQAGFEPADNGVADRGLTTWLLHQIFDCFTIITKQIAFVKSFFTLFLLFCNKSYSFLFYYCKSIKSMI